MPTFLQATYTLTFTFLTPHLTDEMPVMDGPTAAKEIRETLKDDVNIVGITGNVLPEDVRFFRSCGANDVLAKPVKMHDIIASWVENGI